jgi:hypothetical protein
VALLLIAACLTAVLTVTKRWPSAHPAKVAWCVAAVALILFFTVAPVQVLITVYAAGILAVTSRRSPVTPATLAISAGIGVGGGLLMVVLWNPLHTGGPSHSEGSRAMLLFLLLLGVTGTGTALVGKAAARRANGTNDPPARQARAWQYLAAGPLTAASAALVFTLLRVNGAIHVAAMCPETKVLHPNLRPFLCSSAPAIWMFYLVAGVVLGLAIGTFATAAIITPPELAGQPSGQPPPKPLPPSPPPKPPRRPRPDGSSWGGFFAKM